jgi:hypothetical protein
MFAKLRDFDFYRKIPKDLTEATTHGSILSMCAVIFMLVLFLAELMAFLAVTYETNVIIDRSTDTQLRINFNITVLDLPCEYAVIDVVDVLGTRTNNVTKNVNKWQIDSSGIRQGYVGRNREQQDVLHDTHHPEIEILHANGVHAVAIDESNFEGLDLSLSLSLPSLEPLSLSLAVRLSPDLTCLLLRMDQSSFLHFCEFLCPMVYLVSKIRTSLGSIC